MCKNNNYYALSIEPAPTPTSTFPHQHMGIADSGSSSFYFSCGAPVANCNPCAPAVSITVANGAPNILSQALLWPPFLHCPHQQWQAMPCLLFPIPSLVWALLPTRAAKLSSTRHRSQSTILTAIPYSAVGGMPTTLTLTVPPHCAFFTSSTFATLGSFPLSGGLSAAMAAGQPHPSQGFRATSAAREDIQVKFLWGETQ